MKRSLLLDGIGAARLSPTAARSQTHYCIINEATTTCYLLIGNRITRGSNASKRLSLCKIKRINIITRTHTHAHTLRPSPFAPEKKIPFTAPGNGLISLSLSFPQTFGLFIFRIASHFSKRASTANPAVTLAKRASSNLRR